VTLFWLIAFLVVPPDGWIRDVDLDHPLRRIAPDAHLYRPRGDTETLYAVSKSEGQLSWTSLENTADALVADVTARSRATLESRSKIENRGRTIENLLFALPDDVMLHARVTYGRTNQAFHLAVGACRGRPGPPLDACLASLAILDVPIQPEVDASNMRRLAFVTFAALIALTFIGLALRHFLRRRALANTPALADGELLTIAGVVRPAASTIEASLSGKPCVVHRSRARVFSKTNELLGEPADRDAVPFIVETKQGLVHVDPNNIELEVVPSTVVDEATPRQKAFRSRHAVAAETSAQFDEIIVEPGAKISLRGRISVERDAASTAERGYRDDAPTKVRLVSPVVLRVW
jgi:hypothetical protein